MSDFVPLDSRTLLDKLNKKNELIIDYKGCEQWWGRKCTGQKYSLDYVIQDITIETAAYLADTSISDIQNYLKINNQNTFNFI
jgi:hypothetical protein